MKTGEYVVSTRDYSSWLVRGQLVKIVREDLDRAGAIWGGFVPKEERTVTVEVSNRLPRGSFPVSFFRELRESDEFKFQTDVLVLTKPDPELPVLGQEITWGNRSTWWKVRYVDKANVILERDGNTFPFSIPFIMREGNNYEARNSTE